VSELKDWTYVGTGQYTFPGWAVDYSVSLTIGNWKIASASFLSFQDSGNGKYTRAQWDIDLQKIINTTGKIKVDTVTGASGTSKAIQDAVDQAIAQAKK
jgi:uncharacterized protein with FMN-binding domain